MALILPDHDHCEECGDPIALDRRFCSEECLDRFLEGERLQKKKDRTFYGAMGISLAILAVISIVVNVL